MLRTLNCAILDFLDQRSTCTQLLIRSQLDVNRTIGRILDIFFHIQLHDRIFPTRTQFVGCCDSHGVLRCFFAVFFFLGCYCHRRRRQQCTTSSSYHCCSKTSRSRQFQEVTTLERLNLIIISHCFQLLWVWIYESKAVDFSERNIATTKKITLTNNVTASSTSDKKEAVKNAPRTTLNRNTPKKRAARTKLV